MLRIDRNRLWSDLETLGRIGAGERGRTRLAFSPVDLEARGLLVRWMEELGLSVRSDAHANLWGVRAEAEPLPPVVAGSHIDTVREAGMFDGALGVLAGLAAVRAMNEAGLATRHPVAVACFSDEEGGRFAAGGMAGSRAMAGLLTDEALGKKCDASGTSWLTAAAQSGFAGNDRLEPHAYLEYHIEQGPVLDDEGGDIGVVEGIVSLAWLRFTFRRQANHAGAFPMGRRHDASLAAACASVALNRLGLKLGGTVITAGQLELKPNLALMRQLDELHMAYPAWGYRKLTAYLRNKGVPGLNGKRVRRLLRKMGIAALYPKPNLNRRLHSDLFLFRVLTMWRTIEAT